MTEEPLLLLCDHRGEGALERTGELAAAGFRVESTSCLRTSLEHIAAGAPDLLLVDPLAPGSTAELDALEARGEGPNGTPPSPVLVVCDPGAPPGHLSGWEHSGGAWDLIDRTAPAEEWRMRTHRLLELHRSLRDRGELLHRASHDDRTDLLRPRTFEERLSEHFSAAQRHSFDLALVLLDLDRFGLVNKQHDHTVGDWIIAAVGDVIRRSLRNEDVAGRLGGDEFAVLLPYTGKVDAAAVAQRLCREIAALTGIPPGAKGHIDISASLGFESFDGSDLSSLQELRSHAERALRVSKEAGGNRGTYYRSLAAEDGDETAGSIEAETAND
jgi:diguanylate cyclase (GGDEF)-like protein